MKRGKDYFNGLIIRRHRRANEWGKWWKFLSIKRFLSEKIYIERLIEYVNEENNILKDVNFISLESDKPRELKTHLPAISWKRFGR